MRGFCIFVVAVSLGMITQSPRVFGATLTPLWQFTGGTDGSEPEAPLIQGFDANFYGTTSAGTSNGFGTVFEITSSGTLTSLHAFANGADGSYPAAGLVQGTDSNFYGTAYAGGTNTCSCGTVFKITSAGTFTPLWQFSNGTDGGAPEAGPAQVSTAISTVLPPAAARTIGASSTRSPRRAH